VVTEEKLKDVWVWLHFHDMLLQYSEDCQKTSFVSLHH